MRTHLKVNHRKSLIYPSIEKGFSALSSSLKSYRVDIAANTVTKVGRSFGKDESLLQAIIKQIAGKIPEDVIRKRFLAGALQHYTEGHSGLTEEEARNKILELRSQLPKQIPKFTKGDAVLSKASKIPGMIIVVINANSPESVLTQGFIYRVRNKDGDYLVNEDDLVSAYIAEEAV